MVIFGKGNAVIAFDYLSILRIELKKIKLEILLRKE